MSKALHVALIALFVPLAACAGTSETSETSGTAETSTPTVPGVPDPAQPGTQAAELARVTTNTGTTVAFFETAPGQVLVLESGPVATVTALTAANHELPLSALFRDISGAREVPSALLAAEEREAEVQAHLPLEATNAQRTRAEERSTRPTMAQIPVIAPSSTLSGGSCSAATFKAKGGCVGGGNKEWCLLDWWNGAWQAVPSTDLSFASACADIGSFVFHAATGGGSVVDWSVLQGQWASYSFHYGPMTSLRYEIRNASGSRFQFGGSFYWY